MRCPECGSYIENDSIFCEICGFEIQKHADPDIICPNCKNTIPKNSVFCECCGYKIGSSLHNKEEAEKIKEEILRIKFDTQTHIGNIEKYDNAYMEALSVIDRLKTENESSSDEIIAETTIDTSESFFILNETSENKSVDAQKNVPSEADEVFSEQEKTEIIESVAEAYPVEKIETIEEIEIESENEDSETTEAAVTDKDEINLDLGKNGTKTQTHKRKTSFVFVFIAIVVIVCLTIPNLFNYDSENNVEEKAPIHSGNGVDCVFSEYSYSKNDTHVSLCEICSFEETKQCEYEESKSEKEHELIYECRKCNHSYSTTENGYSYINDIKVGDFVYFGVYEQDNNEENGKEEILWEVTDIKDGKLFLVSEYILDYLQYNETKTSVTWETSTLREWLNNEFLNSAFSETEKGQIAETSNENLDNYIFNYIDGGNITVDKIFLLSEKDAEIYYKSESSVFENPHRNEFTSFRTVKKTPYAEIKIENEVNCEDTYWLRNIGNGTSRAATIDNRDYRLSDGFYNSGMYDVTMSVNEFSGIVPAMWLDMPHDNIIKTAEDHICSCENWIATDGTIFYGMCSVCGESVNSEEPKNPESESVKGKSVFCEDCGHEKLTDFEYTEIPSETDYLYSYECAECSHLCSVLRENYLKAKDIKTGDYILFGSYEQDNNEENGKEEIVWEVTDIKDGKLFLVSEYILDYLQYNETEAAATWETSYLREWLNNDFLNSAFSETEKEQIAETSNENPSSYVPNVDMGNVTVDKIFPLSAKDVELYYKSETNMNGNRCSTFRVVKESPYAYIKREYEIKCMRAYWLRNIGTSARYATIVENRDFKLLDGFYYSGMYDPTMPVNAFSGIVPALWLDISCDDMIIKTAENHICFCTKWINKVDGTYYGMCTVCGESMTCESKTITIIE